eukprot:Anaeramoba_ignava/a426_155.p3 GENE.a426_155~~a426_155.p3  ORF type:complete len:417 (-),score=133.97 a426_155:2049-3299(-)
MTAENFNLKILFILYNLGHIANSKGFHPLIQEMKQYIQIDVCSGEERSATMFIYFSPNKLFQCFITSNIYFQFMELKLFQTFKFDLLSKINQKENNMKHNFFLFHQYKSFPAFVISTPNFQTLKSTDYIVDCIEFACSKKLYSEEQKGLSSIIKSIKKMNQKHDLAIPKLLAEQYLIGNEKQHFLVQFSSQNDSISKWGILNITRKKLEISSYFSNIFDEKFSKFSIKLNSKKKNSFKISHETTKESLEIKTLSNFFSFIISEIIIHLRQAYSKESTESAEKEIDLKLNKQIIVKESQKIISKYSNLFMSLDQTLNQEKTFFVHLIQKFHSFPAKIIFSQNHLILQMENEEIDKDDYIHIEIKIDSQNTCILLISFVALNRGYFVLVDNEETQENIILSFLYFEHISKQKISQDNF